MYHLYSGRSNMLPGIEQNHYSYIFPLYAGHSISISAQNGYTIYIYIYTPEYMTGTRFTGRQQYDEHTHQAYNPIRDTSSMITQSRRTQL